MRIDRTKLPKHIQDQIAIQLDKRKAVIVNTLSEPFEGPRYRSKSERVYAQTLTALCHDNNSHVVSFKYETIKLIVGQQGRKNYYYTPDFCVYCKIKNVPPVSVTAREWVEFHEVKSRHRFREKGMAKMRAAQALYPFWKFVLVEA